MLKHYIPRTARGSRKKDRLNAKRYERPLNNGILDPIGRAYRHLVPGTESIMELQKQIMERTTGKLLSMG